jgi:predicted phage tail protein
LKQNLQSTSFLNLELHQLVLITLYCLSNQHLIDEAKQLYNETILRALKQEYELINNELIQQIESNNQQQVNNNVLQIIKDKIDRMVIERPDLFPDLSDDTIERLDDFMSAIENQAAQINLLKKELNNSPPAFRFESKIIIKNDFLF